METHQPLCILLVDDHPSVRRELAQLLADEGDARCCEAGGREEAIHTVECEPPDLVLVDLSLGEEDGLALVADLRARDVPVLVCSLHEEPTYVKQALAAGARGYITKREAPRDLVRTVRDVLDGWVLISPRAVDNLANGPFLIPGRTAERDAGGDHGPGKAREGGDARP